jgi:hypothetical protein
MFRKIPEHSEPYISGGPASIAGFDLAENRLVRHARLSTTSVGDDQPDGSITISVTTCDLTATVDGCQSSPRS